jgi:hypothetical protein
MIAPLELPDSIKFQVKKKKALVLHFKKEGSFLENSIKIGGLCSYLRQAKMSFFQKRRTGR